jgi:hypothetical protein
VVVTNIVMCFEDDRADSIGNVTALVELLDQESQLLWRGGGQHRPDPADGYRFLAQHWRPGDRIFAFGAGTGAFGALALTRLLDTIGVGHPYPNDALRDDALVDHILATWALPRTHRTPADWDRLNRLAAELRGGSAAVSVHYLGLWDATKPAGVQSLSAPDNVLSGRHALAIDERIAPEQVVCPNLDEVWFRGTHADVTGAGGGQPEPARITLDWVLDGACRAGLYTRKDIEMPCPTVRDALATSSRTPAMNLLAGVRFPNRRRVLPDGALVHASVAAYLVSHGEYWERLPHCLLWADVGWPQRGERLAAVGQRVPLRRVALLEQAS